MTPLSVKRPQAARILATVAAVSVGGALIGYTVTSASLVQLGLLLGLAPLTIAIISWSRSAAILGLCLWLTMLGLLRRLLASSGSPGGLGDPFLLAGPIVIVLLFGTAIGRRAAQERSKLERAVYYLCLLGSVQALNPLQGGLTVGVAGLILVVVPMLAFWVGQKLNRDILLRLIELLAVLGLFAAVYGLVQTYIGFPSWDSKWINQNASTTYVSLHVGGAIRPFSSFSSAQEYSLFVAIALVLWIAKVIGSSQLPFQVGARRIPAELGAIGLLAIALFLASARGSLVTAVAALGVIYAARKRARPAWAFLGGIISIALLSIVAGHLNMSTPTISESTTRDLTSHQLSGLADPFNHQSRSSTLEGHFSTTITGMANGFRQPLGNGTGAITVAAKKYGGKSHASEEDPANLAEGFGVLGLVLYVLLLSRGLGASYRLASERRDVLSVAVLGLLVVPLLAWFNGGLYSITWLVWLGLGWVDQQTHCGTMRSI